MSSGETYPKRLIEVDLPIKKISAHSQREKSLRHGHISTLHIWWARRPLAACRAVVLAALWPDPADRHCPERFRREVAARMKALRDRRGGPSRKWEDPLEQRTALLDFIADFANWDLSNEKDYLETSRALVQVAHESLGGAPGTRPLVVDPFAGGGAIPLEAVRVGADAFASDLNPIAVLLNKVALEYIPKYGLKLADEVRVLGDRVKQAAAQELSQLYPSDSDGGTPIAYLWARTVQCEGPACGIAYPLVGQTWVSRSPKGSEELVLTVDEKKLSVAVDRHKSSTAKGRRTTQGSSSACPRCDFVMKSPAIQRQLRAKRGGAVDAYLLAVVCRSANGQRKLARVPLSLDFKAVDSALKKFPELRAEEPSGPFPTWDTRAFVPGLYGVESWNDIHTPRQFHSLLTFARHAKAIAKEVKDRDWGRALLACLALAVGRMVDTMASTCRWVPGTEKRGGSFIAAANGGEKHMRWITDFAEANPFSGETGSWDNQLGWVVRVLEHLALTGLHEGHVAQASADSAPLPDDVADVVATDPPYGSAVPYSDLSDFFYSWLRRILADDFPDLFSEPLTPKKKEAVVNLRAPGDDRGPKDEHFYREAMTAALTKAREIAKPNGMAVIVFADKRTTEWEAMLRAVLSAGWIITGSWPIHTERPGRSRSLGSAALSSSIHLVCRPREHADGSAALDSIGDWRQVLTELPKRIHEWMPRLANEGVVGADAVFACLGPALEVFSRFSRVEKASGEEVLLREYLEHVWAAVAKEALARIFEGADATGFEEDARLTAMWLWTLSAAMSNGAPTESDDAISEDEDSTDDGAASTAKPGGLVLEYDAARKIAQGLGAHLESLTSLVEVKGSSARLLPVAERTRSLFVRKDAGAGTARQKKRGRQLTLGFMADREEAEEIGGWGNPGAPQKGETVLDRVHQSMILFGAGRGEALKRFLVDDGVGHDYRFWRLAQALSALYPASTDEKRWVDGVLARKKGLGF